MKNKIGIYISLFALPAVTTVGYYIFHNRENKHMIEIDASAIIVALLAAVTALFGIIIVEIVGWRKTLLYEECGPGAVGQNITALFLYRKR